jgi:hypothetical protein
MTKFDELIRHREGISLLRSSVALSLACLCTGNIMRSSRSAYLSPQFAAQRYHQQSYLLTFSQDAEAALTAAGLYDTENFSSVGPAGIFALYVNPAAPLGRVFLNEFVSVCSRTSHDSSSLSYSEPLE